jgi:hypothetical protein
MGAAPLPENAGRLRPRVSGVLGLEPSSLTISMMCGQVFPFTPLVQMLSCLAIKSNLFSKMLIGAVGSGAISSGLPAARSTTVLSRLA